MTNRSLGILVCEKERFPPFSDEAFLRNLCLVGKSIGISVFVFSASWVKWSSRTTTGYAYDERKQSWTKDHFPLPTLIYDRSFHRNKSHHVANKRLLRHLNTDRSIHFLGIPLKDKWNVYCSLRNDPILRNHLPKTVKFERFTTLSTMLNAHGKIYLKPTSSSQGKGVLCITKTASSITVQGNTLRNGSVQQSFRQLFSCYVSLQLWLGGRNYISQPALHFLTRDGRPYDVRVLKQKNKAGQWELTGSTVRLGLPGRLTSNLHGGGISLQCGSFLNKHFGISKQNELTERLKLLSKRTVQTLEACYGRLAEVGLDFGIEPSGKIWLIEANSKPGRTAFTHTHSIHEKATQQPIHFAKYLLDRQ